MKTKDKGICIALIIVSVAVHAAEKLLEMFVTPSATVGIVLAMVYTVVLAGVFLALSKTENSFLGLLAALIAYKMLPPKILFLAALSPDANMLYFLVQKLGAAIFVLLIYKFYRMQEQPRAIKPVALVAVMIAVPFTNEIAAKFEEYFTLTNHALIYTYFAQFICYILAALVILAAAYYSGYDSLRFVAYFEYIAFSINILRKVGGIAADTMKGYYVSRSVYVWIAIYVGLMVLFFLAKRRKKKEITQ